MSSVQSLSGSALGRGARALLAVLPGVKWVESRRACRHRVKWPARVRAIAESEWHAGQVVNLSVSGVLLTTQRPYEIGERVEVEIDFLTQPDRKTVVCGVGWIVREDPNHPRRAAIHFDLGYRPKVDS